MNALTAPISFASAYRQLQSAERLFVDGYVADAEEHSMRFQERISLALERGPTAAQIEASRGFLERPLVRAAIVERINDIALASELTVPKLVRELMGIATSSIGNFMRWDEYGDVINEMHLATPAQLATVQSYEYEVKPRGGSVMRIKLHSKQPAIDTLMKYTGALDPDNPHWRAENAKPVNAATLPASTTTEGVAEFYSRMING